MEREQAERSGSRTSSTSDSDSDTDTLSEPDFSCNSEDTESEPEHLEAHRCGALLTSHTASPERKGKQGGEQESENDCKEEKMRNKDDHESDEEQDEMVNRPRNETAHWHVESILLSVSVLINCEDRCVSECL